MSNKAHYLSVLYEKSREDLGEFVVFGQSVFGVGDPDSPIVFIGEAPVASRQNRASPSWALQAKT